MAETFRRSAPRGVGGPQTFGSFELDPAGDQRHPWRRSGVGGGGALSQIKKVDLGGRGSVASVQNVLVLGRGFGFANHL